MKQVNTNTGTIAPVVKEMQLNLPVEAAFRLFTEGISSWWPLKSHSIGAQRAETCVFEGRLGGRIYEVIAGGEQEDWGRVTAWDPPNSVAFTWYPGRDEDPHEVVELTFTGTGSGTQIHLVHTGWERFGERAQEMRSEYDTGWDYVLGQYERRAAS